jgi:hypothetical protein
MQMQVQTISVCLTPLLVIVARATRSDAVGSLTLVIAYTLTTETSSPVELDHTMRLCLLEKGDSGAVYSQPARNRTTFFKQTTTTKSLDSTPLILDKLNPTSSEQMLKSYTYKPFYFALSPSNQYL